ncbi:MAG: LptE family protein [Gemmatimonadetes bacterium]|nr:LptE family protein [Gemmatimonadota bacterium]
MKRPFSRSGPAGLLILLILAAGCGYGFSSSLLPGHIESVHLSVLENRTERADISTALADSLTEAFIDNHTLKVAGEKAADSVVEGAVLEYKRLPFTVDENEQVLEYRIDIVLEVRYVDIRKNKVIWEEPRLSEWDTYVFAPSVGGQEAESEEIGIGRVLAKLTEDILNRTVEGW